MSGFTSPVDESSADRSNLAHKHYKAKRIVMELLIGLLVLYVIYRVIKAVSCPDRTRRSSGIQISIEKPGSRSRFGQYKRPRGKPAKWYGPNEHVKIRGLDIPGGMFYVGEVLLDSMGYDNDACLINPKLKHLPAEPWEAGDEMGYWPRYDYISAKCRGAYLKWLAGGRSDPSAYIGYVFLFFYGLERRLFIDGQNGKVTEEERLKIIQEVRRLFRIYGNNRSFQGYARNFLATEWVLFQRDTAVPDYLNFDDRYCVEPFQFLLGRTVLQGRPISSQLALQWLNLSSDYNLRTPARRCAKEFRALFTQRFSVKFKDGLVVKPNKTHLKLEYHAASPSIGSNIRLGIPDVPNPFILKGPLKKLSALAEECTTELESYSRYLGRKNSDPNDLAALALLPKDIISQSRIAVTVKNQLEQFCSNGPQEIELNELYKCFDKKPPLQFRKKDFESLAILLEGLGLGVAPDIRYHSVKPKETDKVVLFPRGHGVDFRPSRVYLTIGAILRLGAMVSQIDDDISPAEESVLQNVIRGNRDLNNIEKESLLAFLHWCLRTPQETTGLKQRLAEVGDAEKRAISYVLISVAHADGRIDPREVKELEKLYTTLGLDKTQVTSDLHAVAASEPITIERRDQDTSFTIPQAKTGSTIQGLHLNEALIRIREEETKQVKGVLESIFSESIEEDSLIQEEAAASESLTDPLAMLDKTHQDFFHRLQTREKWERKVFRDMCQELGLMMDGAMEVLNEWAFDNANAPLIEDGEPIYVDTSLAKEIMNAR